MRTAMSARRSIRSSIASLASRSTWICGCDSRRLRIIGSSTKLLTISLAVMRTLPATLRAWCSAARRTCSAPSRIFSAGPRKAAPAAVSARPRGLRSKSGCPTPASSAASLRLKVGWLRPRPAAARPSEPASCTARKIWTRPQSGFAAVAPVDGSFMDE